MKICAIVDIKGHCFTTTVRALAARMDHQFDIKTSVEYRAATRDHGPYSADLLYFRSWWPRLRPENARPWLVTVTTGGPVAFGRLADIATPELLRPSAVVTQNLAVHHRALTLGLTSAMIPNGVDSRRYHPIHAPKARRLGLAGSLANPRSCAEKGLGLGEAAATAAGCEFSQTSGLPYLEMPGWYQSLWAYCQPSEREGCSNSTMEAMASGLPCLICKGVGYHGEACEDAREAYDGEVLFVERNTDSITAALCQLQDDPWLYERVSDNARRFAEAHSWERIAERFDSLVHWCVEGRC